MLVKTRVAACLLTFALFMNSFGFASQLYTNSSMGSFEVTRDLFTQETGIQVISSFVDYQTTTDLFQLFLTESMDLDLMSVNTRVHDFQRIAEKGYCVDLTSNAALSAYANRLHDSILRQLSFDGHLFAMPDSISFECMEFDPRTWEAAEYEVQEIPDTFPEFLDFLEDWCNHLAAKELWNFHLKSSWDYTIYNQYTYTIFLTELLLKQHILQDFRAGKPLSFHEDELVELLNRCIKTGKRLYETEAIIEEYDASPHYSLLKNTWQAMFPSDTSLILYLRINDRQPKLIEAYLSMAAITSTSDKQKETMLYLEYVSREKNTDNRASAAYLYKDATPIPDLDYATKRGRLQEQIAQFQAKLNAGEEKDEQGFSLEWNIDTRKRMLEELSPFIISPESLETYKGLTGQLTFPKPTVFWEDKKSRSAYRDYIAQFAAGQMAAEELLSRLDQMAQMMELEGK